LTPKEKKKTARWVFVDDVKKIKQGDDWVKTHLRGKKRHFGGKNGSAITKLPFTPAGSKLNPRVCRNVDSCSKQKLPPDGGLVVFPSGRYQAQEVGRGGDLVFGR